MKEQKLADNLHRLREKKMLFYSTAVPMKSRNSFTVLKKIVEAFASVQPGEYDAVLMDVQMPVMNGLDATKAIRRSPNPLGKTIPIISMTANAFSEDVQNCLNAGMNAHVSKPLDIHVLERTLKSIINEDFSGGGDKCPLIEDAGR